ncbi:MAG: putative lipid II flippase FtsW [Planctomycetota bacterium]
MPKAPSNCWSIIRYRSNCQSIDKGKMNSNHNKILLITLALIAGGIIMVYSSSFFQAENSRSIHDGYFFFKRQFIWIFISIIAMFIIRAVPYHVWDKLSPFLLLGTWALLIAVLIPGIGHRAGGASRWLRFGPVGFQPSEFAKLVIIIFIASFINKNPQEVKSLKKVFLPIAGVVGLTVLLILVEPDIGTAFFITLISGILMVIGGVRLRQLIPIGVIGLTIALLAAIQFYPHVGDRLRVFMNPQADTTGKGYQVNQSLIGLGAGGLTGVGIGLSNQKLFFLPQQHTDFILSIIGEEMGFIGVMMVLALFMGMMWYSRKIAKESPDLFGSLMALGIGLSITIQALFNIAVVSGAVPTKGISLPFISFGGSGLLASMVGIGILLNIASHKPIVQHEKPSQVFGNLVVSQS